MKQVFCSYSTVTEESSTIGDTAENGWYDDGWRFDVMDKPTEGWTPDPWDDDSTDVSETVKYLKSKGVIEASSSHFHPGVWYTTGYQTEDYGTDERVEYNYHLEGYTEAEEREIFEKISK